jgi:hypothetical protein
MPNLEMTGPIISFINTLNRIIFIMVVNICNIEGVLCIKTGDVLMNRANPIATPACGKRQNPRYFLTPGGALVI